MTAVALGDQTVGGTFYADPKDCPHLNLA